MKPKLGIRGGGARPFPHCLMAAAGAGLAALTLLTPGMALAEGDSRTTIVETRGRDRTTTVITHDDQDEGDEWDDYNWTILQMQRESISSQEEQAREAERVRRRAEIEESQEKSSAEHEAYYDAILQDRQAALRAPAGIYYRKPGYSRSEGSGSEAKTVEFGGVAYLYDQGIFWLQQGSLNIVVTAPVGAVVDKLPRGVTRIQAKSGSLWYFFGTFFAEKGSAYEVIKPPAGTTVFYLPDGYTQEKVKGADLYRFGDVFFKPIFIQGVLAFQVAEP
jgi:hypothetical protein